MLPLGNSISSSYIVDQSSNFGDDPPDPINFPLGFPTAGLSGVGIYGASYGNAAGLFKNLGYLAYGIDGIDNGGIAGLVDDYQEGLIDPTTQQSNPTVPSPGGLAESKSN